MSDTAIIGDKNDSLAWLVNQINPDFAEGRMQMRSDRFTSLTVSRRLAQR
jgi:hypothetical protein